MTRLILITEFSYIRQSDKNVILPLSSGWSEIRFLNTTARTFNFQADNTWTVEISGNWKGVRWVLVGGNRLLGHWEETGAL